MNCPHIVISSLDFNVIIFMLRIIPSQSTASRYTIGEYAILIALLTH